MNDLALISDPELDYIFAKEFCGIEPMVSNHTKYGKVYWFPVESEEDSDIDPDSYRTLDFTRNLESILKYIPANSVNFNISSYKHKYETHQTYVVSVCCIRGVAVTSLASRSSSLNRALMEALISAVRKI